MSSLNFSQIPGTLTIKPISAEITDPSVVSGKMRLFCKVRLGKGLLETLPDAQNGQRPRWLSSLAFAKKSEDSITIELYHKNLYFKPKYVGECHLPLDAMIFIAELYGRCDLYQDYKCIGHIDIQIKWEPENNVHPSPISRATFIESPPSSLDHLDSPNSRDNASTVILYQSIGSTDGRQLPAPMRHISLPYLNGGGSNLPTILENFKQAMKKRVEDLTSEPEPEDPDLPDEERCVVCLGKRISGVFYRCGHSCCCAECGVSFIGSKCPICRELVFDFIKIYH